MIRSNTALAILIVLILILFWFYLMHKIRIISRYSRPLTIFVIVSVAIAGGGIVSAEVTSNPAPLNNITSLPLATSRDPTLANPPLLTIDSSLARGYNHLKEYLASRPDLRKEIFPDNK
ncbi:MAG: hypothetical protein RM368_14175 [Nostoc sp. DedSLP03]|uniref:hypothetical protein n=1 Tax=Nostoc sp. DedSLP03 TaxID=3075400 RepID=UPI002AD2A03E|nr:hypothetical protein [Nostoc sp. DedSLP03]MDZ7966106.1 hypothetical protein [Nostoc sp. DedSLP03]